MKLCIMAGVAGVKVVGLSTLLKGALGNLSDCNAGLNDHDKLDKLDIAAWLRKTRHAETRRNALQSMQQVWPGKCGFQKCLRKTPSGCKLARLTCMLAGCKSILDNQKLEILPKDLES